MYNFYPNKSNQIKKKINPQPNVLSIHSPMSYQSTAQCPINPQPNVLSIHSPMSYQSTAQCHINPQPNVISIHSPMSYQSTAQCLLKKWKETSRISRVRNTLFQHPSLVKSISHVDDPEPRLSTTRQIMSRRYNGHGNGFRSQFATIGYGCLTIPLRFNTTVHDWPRPLH